MSTPDRPAREELIRWIEDADCTRDVWTVDEYEAAADAVLDNLPLALEAAREAGKAEQLTRPGPDYGTATVHPTAPVPSGLWRLVGLPVQNEPDQEQ